MTVAGPSRSSWGTEPGRVLVRGRTARAVVGGGARYEVYLATNERLGRQTVLKVLRPSLLDHEPARRAMAREADALCAVRHPGLVRALEVDLDGDRPFIELEHVDGPRLSTRLRRDGPLPAADVTALGRELAGCLAHLHSAGFVHLDVKPSNVILGRVPTLIDLSVARRIDRAHRISGFVGTDAYMSPEQADPSLWSTIGPRADSWSLGVTLYRALVGHLPYSKGRRDATGAERFPQLVESPTAPDSPRHAAVLVAAILDALTGSAEDRPTAADLRDRLEDGGGRRLR